MTASTLLPNLDYASKIEEIRRVGKAARDEFFLERQARLNQMIGYMKSRFPALRNIDDASVMGEWYLGIHSMLSDPKLVIASDDDFFRLANRRLYYQFLDRVRDAKRDMIVSRIDGDGSTPGYEPPASDTSDAANSERWKIFWQRVEQLTPEERVVFEMHYLNDYSQAEIAKILNYEAKPVSRLWLSACVKLGDYLPRRQGSSSGL